MIKNIGSKIDESWSARQLTCYGRIENRGRFGISRVSREWGGSRVCEWGEEHKSGSARQLTCYGRIENEDSVKVEIGSGCERGECTLVQKSSL